LYIRDVLKAKSHEVVSVKADEPLKETFGRFAAAKIRSLAVTSHGVLVGMLTLRDVIAFLERHGAAALEMPVDDAMTGDVVRIRPDASLEEAAAIFQSNDFNHLPVEDDEGRLVGIVTPADVLARRVQEVEDGAAYLRNYIAGMYH